MLAGSLTRVGWNKGETIVEGWKGRWAGGRLVGEKEQTGENEEGISVHVFVRAWICYSIVTI